MREVVCCDTKETRELMAKGLMTIPQAAKFLKVSRRTVQRLIEKGKLGYTRGGRVRRIARVELERYSAVGYVPARAK